MLEPARVNPVDLSVISEIAPIRVVSIDIECLATGKDSMPDKDSVIQIANIVKVHGREEPIFRVIFTLDECAQIRNTEVLSYGSEA